MWAFTNKGDDMKKKLVITIELSGTPEEFQRLQSKLDFNEYASGISDELEDLFSSDGFDISGIELSVDNATAELS